jgi:hypothetical protein
MWRADVSFYTLKGVTSWKTYSKTDFLIGSSSNKLTKDNKASKSEPSKSDTEFGSADTEIVGCNTQEINFLIWSIKQCTACPENYYAEL